MGVIKVRLEGEEEIYTVTGGLAEIQPDIVTILADAAENVEEIDIARAREARARAQEILEQGPPPEDLDRYLAIEAALRRSNLRLEAARRYKTGRSRIPQREEPRGE
jgi:F-type H+-transporting ATPase subunit epsilon